METSLSKSGLRRLDNIAKDILGMPENLLIENAARGLRDVIENRKIGCTKTCILAGPGNNGADSLALARHLLMKGSRIKIFLITKDKKENEQVQFQLKIIRCILAEQNITYIDKEDKISFLEQGISKDWLIIDGIFGIGFKLPLDSFYKKLFRVVNDKNNRVVAVDIPSGLVCDSGQQDEVCLRADYTVTFLASKEGFYKEGVSQVTGEIFVKDIGVSKDILENL